MKRKELRKIELPMATLSAIDEIYEKLPQIKCKGKCVNSCSPVGDLMSNVEFLRITKHSGKKPNGYKDRAAGKFCNMLSSDGKCTVHAVRPAICRIWGVDVQLQCPFGCEVTGRPIRANFILEEVFEASGESALANSLALAAKIQSDTRKQDDST